MAAKRNELLQGTLDLLILRTLALEPMHGWAIAKRIHQRSQEALNVQQGSLYPALYRLQDRGLIRSKWSTGEEGRPVKVYRLTADGRRQLDTETKSWRHLAAAVDLVLQAGGG